MASREKTPVSDFETASEDTYLRSQMEIIHRLHVARAGLSGAALLMGVVVLGVTASSIQVYNTTRLSSALSAETSWLSMWPSSSHFDFRPTIAMVVGSCLVILANFADLTTHLKIPSVIKTRLIVAAPLLGLFAALIAMIFFYAVNASVEADTLLSWSCRWRYLSMTEQPHFDLLCGTNHAAVYLAILLIPVETVALGLAFWQLKFDRFISAYAHARKGSPNSFMT